MIALLDTLGPAIWRASWQAAALAVVVFALTRCAGERLSPRWRFLLWGVVVARLLFVATPGSPWSVFNLVRADDDNGHVQPIALRYRTPEDEFCIAPAYVGELNLVASFWRVTGEPRITAELIVLPSIPAGSAHRRELSRTAEKSIRTVLVSSERAPVLDTRAGRRA